MTTAPVSVPPVAARPGPPDREKAAPGKPGKRQALSVTAVRNSGWTDYRAEVPERKCGTAWSLLEINRTLGDPIRFTLDPNGRLCLRAEVWADLDPGLTRVSEAFRRAVRVLGESPANRAPLAPVETTGLDAVLGAARERGWKVSSRPDRRGLIDLEASRRFYQATAEVLGPGLRLSVELARIKAAAPEVRLAIGRFLLAATDGLRMVRATGQLRGGPHQEQTVPGLDLLLPPEPGGEVLDAALGALAAGCRYLGEEVHALADASTAHRYLESHPNGGLIHV